jgi:hypothetical protein
MVKDVASFDGLDVGDLPYKLGIPSLGQADRLRERGCWDRLVATPTTWPAECQTVETLDVTASSDRKALDAGIGAETTYLLLEGHQPEEVVDALLNRKIRASK